VVVVHINNIQIIGNITSHEFRRNITELCQSGLCGSDGCFQFFRHRGPCKATIDKPLARQFPAFIFGDSEIKNLADPFQSQAGQQGNQKTGMYDITTECSRMKLMNLARRLFMIGLSKY
jgi:hypothetical protein